MYSNAYTDVVLKLPTIPPRYRFASAMAPKGLKQTPICKLGRVQQTQSSQWRARAWLDGRNVCGPHRSQETEAQADLQVGAISSSWSCSCSDSDYYSCSYSCSCAYFQSYSCMPALQYDALAQRPGGSLVPGAGR